MSDKPPPNPEWYGAGEVVPVDPHLCVYRGYEYKQHEPYPYMYECSRCGVSLPIKEGKPGV